MVDIERRSSPAWSCGMDGAVAAFERGQDSPSGRADMPGKTAHASLDQISAVMEGVISRSLSQFDRRH